MGLTGFEIVTLQARHPYSFHRINMASETDSKINIMEVTFLFPQNIKITLQEIDEQLRLIVQDDGVGTEPLQLEIKSFLFSLIKSFARRLDAELDIKNENGLSVEPLINNYQKAA